MPPVRNRNVVILMTAAAVVSLVVAIAAFRDYLPESLGLLGLGLFILCLAMIVAIGWETRRGMLAARGPQPTPGAADIPCASSSMSPAPSP